MVGRLTDFSRWHAGASTVDGLVLERVTKSVIFLKNSFLDLPQVAANEGGEYQYLMSFDSYERFLLSVQAKSISILLTNYRVWRNVPEFVLQLDGGSTGRESSIKSCWEINAGEEKCENAAFFVSHVADMKKLISVSLSLSLQNASFLEHGEQWVHLSVKARSSKKGVSFEVEKLGSQAKLQWHVSSQRLNNYVSYN